MPRSAQLSTFFLGGLFFAAIGAGLPTIAKAETLINGAGATFPYPIYSKWFNEYHKAHPDIQVNREDVLRSADAHVAIAAPGLSKATSVARHFQPLWVLAKRRLTEAGAIVFVGYGMPQTEALARLEIQDAIRADNAGEPCRRIDIVKGPNTGSDSVQRLVALLEPCRAARQLVVTPATMPKTRRAIERYLYIQVHRLGAEDFLPDYRARIRDWKPVVETGAVVSSNVS